MSPTSQRSGPSPQQLNALARQLIQTTSVDMIQQIYSTTLATPTGNPVITVIPRMVGLIKGFWVKVTGTVTNASGGTAITPTDFGPSNLLSQVQFNDLNNNTRIQTPGWHLALVNSFRAKRPFGTSFLSTAWDEPVNYGSNWTVNQATASIAGTSGTGTVTFWYYVPLAYSDSDYRGAVYANVVNATMQLLLTLNTGNVSVASGDSTLYLYKGQAGAVLSAVTIVVYQHYMDQIPMGQAGPVLPTLDLSTIYELKQTVVSSITAGQDFPIQYSNFRDFLSTIAVYYNGSTRGVGADINYWALQSANFTNLWKMEPSLIALRTRNHLSSDPPPGVYYFGSRNKPIATTQYGNMELILNPITAGATAYALVGYEDFALINQVTGAGSLAAN